MKKTLLTFICILLLSTSQNLYAKTMHVIAFCNTNDAKIGDAAEISHDLFISGLNDLAFMLGYEINSKSFIGNDCSKENLVKAISNTISTPDDIIVFYYFGHGTRAQGQTSPFPQMCLKYQIYDQDKFMPVQYIIDRLDNQNAHLKLIISACCNNVVGGVSPKNNMCDAMGFTQLNNVNIDNYKKLFNNFSGTVAITGCKAGQYSWCNSDFGGLFDVKFWETLDDVGLNRIPANWNDMLDVVKRRTDELAYRRTDPPTHQVPYFEIKPKDSAPKHDNNDSWDNDKGRDYNPRTNDEFQSAISTMISEPDVNKRIAMVDDIINRFFAEDKNVYVHVLGRNMTTVVDVSDIRSYLNSVALSNRIVRVNNLGRTIINSYPVIKVHEIRK